MDIADSEYADDTLTESGQEPGQGTPPTRDEILARLHQRNAATTAPSAEEILARIKQRSSTINGLPERGDIDLNTLPAHDAPDEIGGPGATTPTTPQITAAKAHAGAPLNFDTAPLPPPDPGPAGPFAAQTEALFSPAPKPQSFRDWKTQNDAEYRAAAGPDLTERLSTVASDPSHNALTRGAAGAGAFVVGAVQHPVATADAMADAAPKALWTLQQASTAAQTKAQFAQAGLDPDKAPPGPTTKETIIAAAQLAALGTAGPLENMVGKVFAEQLTARAAAKGYAAAAGLDRAAAVVARAIGMAPVGAAFNSGDPLAGALSGAILGGTHATLTGARATIGESPLSLNNLPELFRKNPPVDPDALPGGTTPPVAPSDGGSLVGGGGGGGIAGPGTPGPKTLPTGGGAKPSLTRDVPGENTPKPAGQSAIDAVLAETERQAATNAPTPAQTIEKAIADAKAVMAAVNPTAPQPAVPAPPAAPAPKPPTPAVTKPATPSSEPVPITIEQLLAGGAQKRPEPSSPKPPETADSESLANARTAGRLDARAGVKRNPYVDGSPLHSEYEIAFETVPTDDVGASNVLLTPATREGKKKIHDDELNAKIERGLDPTRFASPKEPEQHDYSSTQINLPAPTAAAIAKLGAAIPDADLADDGRETTPHVTVKYGLHGTDPDAVRKLLADEPPITATFGTTSIFPASESGTSDVVKVDVDSPDLHRLNKKIADALPHTDTHPEYSPHATIAYVKPGLGQQYVGNDVMKGHTVTIDHVTFSGKDGTLTQIPLGGTVKGTAPSSLIDKLKAGRTLPTGDPDAPPISHPTHPDDDAAQSGVQGVPGSSVPQHGTASPSGDAHTSGAPSVAGGGPGVESGAQAPAVHPTPAGRKQKAEAVDLSQSPHVEGLTGHDTHAVFSDGTRVQSRYRVIEASELHPSHHPSSFDYNPAYPKDVQGREYNGPRGKAAREHVIAQTGKLDSRVLDQGNGLTDGPPLITPHGIAVAGNQRAMMLIRAHTMAPEKAAAIRKELEHRAASYGFDPAEIRAMTSPVLVREITDPSIDTSDVPTLARLNQLSDQAPTKAKDALSSALGRATQMREAGAALQFFNETIAPDQSLREYLGSADGAQFVRKLFFDGVFTPQERGAIIDPKGALTTGGKDAVESLMRVAAIGDVDVLHLATSFIPAILAKLDLALPALMRAAATKTYSLEPRLQDALTLLVRVAEQKADMKARGESTLGFGVAAYANFQDIFDSAAAENVVDLATFLESQSKAQITEVSRQYAADAEVAARAAQSDDIFGEAPEAPAHLEKRLFGGENDRVAEPEGEYGTELAKRVRAYTEDFFAGVGGPPTPASVADAEENVARLFDGAYQVWRAMHSDTAPAMAGDDMLRAFHGASQAAADAMNRLTRFSQHGDNSHFWVGEGKWSRYQVTSDQIQALAMDDADWLSSQMIGPTTRASKGGESGPRGRLEDFRRVIQFYQHASPFRKDAEFKTMDAAAREIARAFRGVGENNRMLPADDKELDAEENRKMLPSSTRRSDRVSEQGGLFGDEPTSEPEQESMFGQKDGTDAARNLAQTERAARAELAGLRQRAALETDPKKSTAIAQRMALLTKLVDRGGAITSSEMANRARADAEEPTPDEPDQESNQHSLLEPESRDYDEARADRFEQRRLNNPNSVASTRMQVEEDEGAIGPKDIVAALEKQILASGLPLAGEREGEIAAARKVNGPFAVNIKGMEFVNPYTIYRAIHIYRDPAFERVHVIYLDTNDKVLGHEITTSGKVGYSSIKGLKDSIPVMAQQLGATKVVLAHNHPSGDSAPSDLDVDATNFLSARLKQHGIHVVGHLVMNHALAHWIASVGPKKFGTAKVQLVHAPASPYTTAIQAGRSRIIGADQMFGVLHLVTDPRATTLVHLDSTRRVIAVEPISMSIDELAKFLPGRMEALGSRLVFLAAPPDLATEIEAALQRARPRKKYQHADQWTDDIVDVITVHPDGSGAISDFSSGTSHFSSGATAGRVPARRKADGTPAFPGPADIGKPIKVQESDAGKPGPGVDSADGSVRVPRLARGSTGADDDGGRGRRSLSEEGDDGEFGPGVDSADGHVRVPRLARGQAGADEHRDRGRDRLHRDAEDTEAPGDAGPSSVNEPEGQYGGPVGSAADLSAVTTAHPTPDATGLEHERSKLRLREMVPSALAYLNPEALGPAARGTAGSVRDHTAQGFHQLTVSREALKDFARAVGRLPKAAAVEFWNAAEQGLTVKGIAGVSDEAATYFDAGVQALHDITFGYTKQLIALGRLHADHALDDYIGRFWSKPKTTKARAYLGRMIGRRPFEGPKSFLKARSLELFTDGLDAGLIPATYNYVDSQLAKIEEMVRVISATRILRAERATGRAKPIMDGFTPPRDKHGDPWVRIDKSGNDPAFTIFGNPDATHWEAVDTMMFGKLQALVDALNIRHQRKVKVRRDALGHASPADGIVTKFGGAEGVLAHELGHMLDWKYDLADRVDVAIGKAPRRTVAKGKRAGTQAPDYTTEKKNDPKAIARRATLREELRQLANLRRETMRGVPETKDLGKTERAYLHSTVEKMANMVEAYIHARPRFKQVAPGIFAIMDDIIEQHPELHPLRDIHPSLARDEHYRTEEKPGILHLGYWYAPKESAAVWHNHLSKGLRGNPWVDAMLTLGQGSAQLVLGLSGFHAMVMATEGIYSDIALGVDNLVNTHGDTTLGVKQIAASLAAPVRTMLLGRQIMQEYRVPGLHPQFQAALDAMRKGGFRGTAKSELWTGERRTKFEKAFKDAISAESKGQRLWGAARLPLNALWAALELSTLPVMGKYVPWMKTGATYMAVAQMLKKLPPDTPMDQVHLAMGRIVKQMDYRFGQVTYENHFFSHVAKDLAQMVLLAPGWTGGTVILMGRGAHELARPIVGAGRKIRDRINGSGGAGGAGGAGGSGGNDEESHIPPELIGPSAAYWIGAVAAHMFISGLATFLLTGELPHDKDYFGFRDGTLDQDGNPNRHTIPGYLMHDVYGWTHQPRQTALNKLSPAVTFMARAMTNSTYFGDEIYNPDDPFLTKTTQVAEETMHSFSPISVENYLNAKQKGAGGLGEMARNAAGINPPRKEFSRTDAQNLMARYLALRGHTKRTPEKVAQAERKGTLMDSLRAGTLNRTDIRDRETAGVITREQGQTMLKQSRVSHLVTQFQQLDSDQMKRVYALGTDDEQHLWRKTLDDRAHRDTRRDAINQARARAGRAPLPPEQP